MKSIRKILAIAGVALMAGSAQAQIQVVKVTTDLSNGKIDKAVWKNAPATTVTLMAQPMALPRPKTTETPSLKVQAVHDGKWAAFRLTWKAKVKAEAGQLAKFSDAVAIQFPVNEGPPPPIFMGAKGSPVHIFHWRAQYQRDIEKGKPEMRDLYPNMNPDMYPMEFKDPGYVKGLTDENREVYSPGKAEGNPQSYAKANAVDEIYAEGFGSSSIIQNRMSNGHGEWNKGEWSVVISRPMQRDSESALAPGKASFAAFAVWQGAKQEVGSRKSVTMSWVPLQIAP